MDRRLEYVLAVVNCGSFTAAAQAIGITQPGMTKAISELERELGYALFHRTARGAQPTEKGREFIERARRVLDDVRLLLRGERDCDPYADVLRIGICPSSLEWLLASPLARLLRRHPLIRFEVAGGTFERIAQLLRNGTIDVAIGFDDAFTEWRDVRRTQLGLLEMVLFVREGHPCLQDVPHEPEELTRYAFVVPSESRPYGMLVRNLFESRGLPWRRNVHFIDNFQIVRSLVRESDAIGVATVDYANTSEFARHYRRVPIECPFPPAALCCATRASFEPTPPVRAFTWIMRAFLPPTFAPLP